MSAVSRRPEPLWRPPSDGPTRADRVSDIWSFDQTRYYRDQTGPDIVRQFVSLADLIPPGELAQIKHQTNAIEQQLVQTLEASWPRPVNLDPGLIEPSKLILATTKNYAHRIYIGSTVRNTLVQQLRSKATGE